MAVPLVKIHCWISTFSEGDIIHDSLRRNSPSTSLFLFSSASGESAPSDNSPEKSEQLGGGGGGYSHFL